ncbi:uncharacterized protein si:ch1073-126c3.2 isoform X2 [Heptranchias perlo]|uniref:uncharacterized protein si:ch1073-126c3.2 isoform X2 n=1 Tax=Heptranchias perlo TaxID=212740 RepID=UPI00355946B9
MQQANMDRKLHAVFALIGVIWVLVPGIYLTEEADTCQDLLGTDNYLNFSKKLKILNNCTDNNMKSLDVEKRGELLGLLQNAADKLKSIHVKACQNVSPKNCSFPQIPANGGLICLTLERIRYCKPMCNKRVPAA